MPDTRDLGWLVEANVREAWQHEALDFTPWLAENLDRLGDALGLRLELEGTEVTVESFAADILARDVVDNSRVLIENQLERTDHAHLGQILTYLGGLDARKVIWISPEFQEAHLSAIRWLNDHTADDFAFFAVRLRLVRIGESPYAPVFEVLARPSEWERRLNQQRRLSEYTPNGEKRFKFWNFYLQRHPQAADAGLRASRHWTQWLPVYAYNGIDNAIQISLSISAENGGIYVRGGWGERKFSAQELLSQKIQLLSEKLNLHNDYYKNENQGHLFGEFRPLSYLDESQWEELADWLEDRRQAYTQAIREVLETNA